MKLGQIAQLVFVLVAATAVYLFVTMARDAEARRACVPLCAMRPHYAGDNRMAPDFELPDLKGGKLRLSDLRGKTVVLNFWTSSCGPCLEEMPSLAELRKMLATRSDVVMLTVSTDPTPDSVTATLQTVLSEKPPFSIPVLLDPDAKIVGEKYGTHLFPETWIVDPQGVVRARFDGARDWSNALVLSLIDAIAGLRDCDIEFRGGVPTGDEAGYCDEAGSSES